MSTQTSSTASATRIHRYALVLGGSLFVLFVAASGLYARYGYAVVLWVFEEHQIGRAEDRVGPGKLVELEDYLRVDPANLRVRGLLVNQWIEFNDPAGAVEAARAGLAAAPADQRPIAMLLYARAQLASGSLGEAESTYREVLQALGESGEAHYGLAHIAAARGEFETMRKEYQSFKNTKETSNTSDFSAKVRTGESFIFRLLKPTVTIAQTTSVALMYEISGDIEDSLSMIHQLEEFSGAPPFALFLRGVCEEEQDHRDAALDFYKRAAGKGDALGAFAYRRLSHL